MFYKRIHAVLRLLMVEIYRIWVTFIYFFYTVCLVGDILDKSEVEVWWYDLPSAKDAIEKPGSTPRGFCRIPFQSGTSIFPLRNVCLFLWVYCVFVTIYIHVDFMSLLFEWLSVVYVVLPAWAISSLSLLSMNSMNQTKTAMFTLLWNVFAFERSYS